MVSAIGLAFNFLLLQAQAPLDLLSLELRLLPLLQMLLLYFESTASLLHLQYVPDVPLGLCQHLNNLSPALCVNRGLAPLLFLHVID